MHRPQRVSPRRARQRRQRGVSRAVFHYQPIKVNNMSDSKSEQPEPTAAERRLLRDEAVRADVEARTNRTGAAASSAEK